MTLGIANRNDYIGTGLVDTYAYGFKIFVDGDLEVTVRDTAGVETLLTLNIDYTVTGAGLSAGGTIVLDDALADDSTLTVRRVVDLVQDTDIRNQQSFFPDVLESQFDYSAMIDQQQQDAIDRSIKIPVSFLESFDLAFPAPGAGKFIRWNNAGLALEAVAAAPDDDTFTASGLGAVARAWSAKVGEIPSLKDFGAVGNGVANDTAAALAAMAAYPNEPIYVPHGTYSTTLNRLTTMTGQFEGPGIIIDADGNKRGRWFVNQSAPLSDTADTSGVTTWFNGDWRWCRVPIEQVITVPPITTGSLVTNAGTASGTVLHFAAVPSWVAIGTATGMSGRLLVKGTNIPAGTYVSSITATTVTLTQAVSGAVASGATITFGISQYLQPFAMSPEAISVYAAPNTISANQIAGADTGGIAMSALTINLHNASGGSGLCGVWVQSNIAAGFAGYDAAYPYNTASTALYGGKAFANAHDVYLTGFEFEMEDGGYRTTSNGLILDTHRTNAGTGPQHYWNNIIFNNGACTVPVDRWFGGSGPSKWGGDFTGGDFSSNGYAAIVIKAGDKMYLNPTVNAYGASAVGDCWVGYVTAKDAFSIVAGHGVDLIGAAPTVAANHLGMGSNTSASANTGANGAPPAQVLGYMVWNIGGTAVKVPYYAN